MINMNINITQQNINLNLSFYFIGVYDKGSLEVTNCFAVPHNESEDEVRDCRVRQSSP
jgi:hypothetical protein